MCRNVVSDISIGVQDFGPKFGFFRKLVTGQGCVPRRLITSLVFTSPPLMFLPRPTPPGVSTYALST